MEDVFLVVIYLCAGFGIATAAAYLADYLESKYPWRKPW